MHRAEDDAEARAAAARLRLALELFDAGVAMRRLSLQRQHPQSSPEQIEQLVRLWLLDRPGARHGDAIGPVSGRPALTRS